MSFPPPSTSEVFYAQMDHAEHYGLPSSRVARTDLVHLKDYMNDIARRLDVFEAGEYVYDPVSSRGQIPIVGPEFGTLARFTLSTVSDYDMKPGEELLSERMFEIMIAYIDKTQLYVGEPAQSLLAHRDGGVSLLSKTVYYGMQLRNDTGWVMARSDQAQRRIKWWNGTEAASRASFLPNGLVVGRVYESGPDNNLVRVDSAVQIRPARYANPEERMRFTTPAAPDSDWFSY